MLLLSNMLQLDDSLWEQRVRCGLSTFRKTLLKLFDAHCCHMGTGIKHPVPHRVKLSFVSFDILAL